ncbi:MAG TPA: glycosyltransferase family 4 protein [Thermoanaerobaculia bacterium]|jgi:glycosyltransferase involved in cell wall biosynthesis
MRTIHFCVESFDPSSGGMEASAARIARFLASDPENRVVTHAMESLSDGCLGAQAARIMRPLAEERDWFETVSEWFRLRTLLLRNFVACDLRAHPGTHVLLSFFLGSSGFIAQNVAADFGLSHVAAARGTDLGRGLFSPAEAVRVQYVLRHATSVVVTNREHDHYVRAVGGRTIGVQTIYNALPPSVAPVWERSGRNAVRLVTAGGFTLKKGTHLLVESVMRLLDEGLPVELAVAGPEEKREFWRELRQALPPAIAGVGVLRPEEIEPFLLGGDLFCSASLSEGCSNVTMTALGLGMPIVSTRTGALPDLASDLGHVRMTPPADVDAFTGALRDAVQAMRAGSLYVDRAAVRAAVAPLTAEEERSRWLAVIARAATTPSSA